MTNSVFAQLPEPLAYAESLLAWFTRMGIDSDESTLPDLCVAAAAQLSQCELSQLYGCDESTGRLDLIAQHLPGALPPGDLACGPDFQHQQLLHYVLSRCCSLSLENLEDSVYESGFLPATTVPWRSLVCVPLVGRHNAVAGLLLCASRQPRWLQNYGPSLSNWVASP